jgi:hypothetical protein
MQHLLRWPIIVLVTWSVLTIIREACAQQTLYVLNSTDQILALEAKAEEILDDAEHLVERVWSWTKNHRNLVKGVTGGLVLTYGENSPIDLTNASSMSSHTLTGLCIL